jgi:nucleoid-associated protein YgaU
MQLRNNNPYHIGTLVILSDGEIALDRAVPNIPGTVYDKLYVIKDNDELSQLAFSFYGDSKLWWILADRNNIMNPFELTVGTALIVPDLNLAKLAMK